MHQNKQKIDCNRGGRSFCCTGSELTPPPIFASMQNTHLDSSDLFPANVLDVLCTVTQSYWSGRPQGPAVE